MRFVNSRFGDFPGSYASKPPITKTRVFQRAGMTIRTKSNARGNKQELDYTSALETAKRWTLD